jgi:hypothetical protein
MVEAADVPDVLLDAARLVGTGEIVVFGSAALAFSLPNAPRTRDVDIWCEPAERGDIVVAVMGEVSWYQQKHDAYVEVWGPETFTAPADWRSRAQVLTEDAAPGVRLVVPHPHDVLVSKLERWEEADRDHARLILASYPLSREALASLASRTPYRTGVVTDPARVARFEAHLAELIATL